MLPLIQLIRPHQWVKNCLLYAPLFFSGQLFSYSIVYVTCAVICFCIVSSIGYIFNDWVDRDRDKYHPEKKTRPFCSGSVTGIEAFFLVGILISVLAFCIWYFNFGNRFKIILLLYLALTLSYSLHIKHIVILELFFVSLGFVLRVIAGGAVSSIPISNWLFLTVFFISMLISVAKRMSEFIKLGQEKAIQHRSSQEGYSFSYLEHLLWICGGVTLVVYALYVVDQGGIMVCSVLPASYGIFRFIYLSEKGKGADPIKALFRDRQLMATTLVFFSFMAIMIYAP